MRTTFAVKVGPADARRQARPGCRPHRRPSVHGDGCAADRGPTARLALIGETKGDVGGLLCDRQINVTA